MAQKKAARVLPEPGSAAINILRPAAIAGHASLWAGVGPVKLCSNHAPIAG